MVKSCAKTKTTKIIKTPTKSTPKGSSILRLWNFFHYYIEKTCMYYTGSEINQIEGIVPKNIYTSDFKNEIFNKYHRHIWYKSTQFINKKYLAIFYTNIHFTFLSSYLP